MTEERLEDTIYNCLDFCLLNGRTPHFYLGGPDPIRHPALWTVLELLREENASVIDGMLQTLGNAPNGGNKQQVEFTLIDDRAQIRISVIALVIAGLRIALVSTVGIATIAASINAGGLGTILFDGLRTMNTAKILWGSLLSAALAVAIDRLLLLVERKS